MLWASGIDISLLGRLLNMTLHILQLFLAAAHIADALAILYLFNYIMNYNLYYSVIPKLLFRIEIIENVRAVQ